jgi:hypothetical protein
MGVTVRLNRVVGDLRVENRDLRARIGVLENKRESAASREVKREEVLSNEEFLELMRLRGEVGVLRLRGNNG